MGETGRETVKIALRFSTWGRRACCRSPAGCAGAASGGLLPASALLLHFHSNVVLCSSCRGGVSGGACRRAATREISAAPPPSTRLQHPPGAAPPTTHLSPPAPRHTLVHTSLGCCSCCLAPDGSPAGCARAAFTALLPLGALPRLLMMRCRGWGRVGCAGAGMSAWACRRGAGSGRAPHLAAAPTRHHSPVHTLTSLTTGSSCSISGANVTRRLGTAALRAAPGGTPTGCAEAASAAPLLPLPRLASSAAFCCSCKGGRVAEGHQ